MFGRSSLIEQDIFLELSVLVSTVLLGLSVVAGMVGIDPNKLAELPWHPNPSR